MPKSDAPPPSFSIAVSPHGQVYLGPPVADEVPLAAESARRIAAAFARGPGHGVLHLGAAELSTALPAPFAYFRDLGRLFMARLCAVPDLEELRERVEVPAPREELSARAAAAPPMTGAEYLGEEVLSEVWAQLLAAARADLAALGRGRRVQEYLREQDPLWNLVGRVCFHLAENQGDAAVPFAFMATYTSRISAHARVQHVPLGQALREYAGARNQEALLSLLLPVQRAAEKSALLKALVDSHEVFHPLAWTPGEAYRFLQDIPVFEAAGVLVRVPDFFRGRRPERPQVSVTIGEKPPARLGRDALLDFSVRLTLGGEELSEKEWQEILRGGDGLLRIRGRWVEIDRERLSQVLDHWKKAQRAAREGGISFVEGMRLLAGADLGGGGAAAPAADSAREWSEVQAGPWLDQVLQQLRQAGDAPVDAVAKGDPADPGPQLVATLRPYQRAGVRWLWLLARLGLGACLADDMGLGKTIQVLALLLLRRLPDGPRRPSLLVLPASLLANWRAEMQRFAPGLRAFVAHPSATPAEELARMTAARAADFDVVMVSYAALLRLPWLAEVEWDLVVADEAQAIKNPAAKQTRAIKTLRSRARVALTGTPVENRLGDLWSIFDFLCPGLLGPAKVFGDFVRRMQDGAGGYAPLRRLLKPYLLRRMKSDKRIIADLPDKTEVRAFCSLSRRQAALYEQAVQELAAGLQEADGMKRRGLILAFLMRFKQICNHPSHWLGDGGFEPQESGKFARLRELCEAIAARQEKVLVFTQFREMTLPLAGFLEGVFGRPGLVLSGETQVRRRMALVEDFQRDSGPPFFVLSLKAGGTGLNLTAAAHVIHFDRWWNPAVENQATDRAYRIGQQRNVLVHKFVCRGTVEEKIDALIEAKQGLAGQVVEGGGELLLTEMDNQELLRLVSLDIRSALEEA